MTRKLLLASLVLCLFALGITPLGLSAQTDRENPTDLLTKMEREGWTRVMEGVLQRHQGENKVENFAYGPEGMKWALQDLQNRHNALVDQYEIKPTRKLKQAILKIKKTIEGIREGLDKGEFSSTPGKQVVNGCDVSFGYHASAYPLSYGQGVGAVGDANFYSTCLSGEVYAEARGYATNGSTLTQYNQYDGPKYGSNISAYASTAVGGGQSCHSDAYSYVYNSSLGFYSTSANNNSCPPPPVTVSITSGPTSTSITGYTCKTLTWTASASGGVPGYSYAWYEDGYYAGSGSSFSATFCGDNIAYTQYVNISVTATDSLGSQASASRSVSIRYSRSTTCDPYATSTSDDKMIICPQEPY